MTCRLILVLVLLLVGPGGCTGLHWATLTGVVGTVTLAEGIPGVSRDGRPYVLDAQSLLYAKDLLTMNGESLIEVELTTGAHLQVSPRAELLIDSVQDNGVTQRHFLNLSSGALEISSVDAEDTFSIGTNIARINSNGAGVWIGYSAGYKRLDVVLLSEGTVTISNRDGQTSLTSRMDACVITPGAAPRQKTTWSESKYRATRQQFNDTRNEET